jgi:MFS transporter, DHA2 family, multidrug resistance protein
MPNEPGPTIAAVADGLPPPQRRWAVLTLAVGLVLSVLDSTIVNIALPAIARQLHATPAQSIWVVNAYQIAMVSALFPLASLGDIFGYRRIYRLGLVLFTIASLASALSHSLLMLAAARAAQGVGAAGMTAVNSALVRYTYPRRQLGRGIAMTAAVVSITAAAGPTVAALILAVANWPWLFAINVPIGIVTFALALRLLPANPPSPYRFDLTSGLLSAAAFALLMSGINDLGHAEALVLVVPQLLLGIAAGWLLVRRQSGLPLPLLPVDLFRRPIFALSVATSVASFVAQGIAFVALPFYFQDVLGHSQATTGLLMTPWPAVVAAVAPVVGRLADRYPAGILGGIGLAILALGFVLLASLPAAPNAADIVWRMLVCGLGFGFFQSPNNRAIVSSAPPERSGSAGAVQGTSRLVGQTIGAALVALVLALAGHPAGPGLAIWLAAACSALAAVASLSRLLRIFRRGGVPRPRAPRAGSRVGWHRFGRRRQQRGEGR